jgi:O-antigen ligase
VDKPLRQGVAPAYLLACLLLGGSAQGIWTNALLQLIGLAIIAWAAAAPTQEPLSGPVRQLLWLLMIALAAVALQLVPLPASLWPNLGGRAEFSEGYRVLGMAVPARPLSLSPYQTLSTLLTLIPPIALFAAIVRLKAYRASWLVLAALAGAFAGIVLGALQLSSPDALMSPWYLYPQNSFGAATGFFANTNNMAMLMVICLPLVAALAVSARGGATQRSSTVAVLCAAAGLMLLLGIGLNGSDAGLLLSVPVAITAGLLVIPGRNRWRRVIAAGAGLSLIAVVAMLAFTPIGERGLGTAASPESRLSIMSTTAKAAGDFLPFGSGLGTFRGVYQLYEDHDRLTNVHINHAHNDYLELILELGVPGVLLILAFLSWWAVAVWRAWRYSDGGAYARAASIASAALLAHSLVEFPLRTAALSACFAMCLALLVERRSQPAGDRSDLRPTRHVELR